MKSRTLLHFYIVLLLNLSITSAQTLKVEPLGKHNIVIKTIGTNTRNVVTVVLPPNTVEWYYSFTTDTEGKTTDALNLAVQLGGLVASAYYGKAAGSILSQIKVPKGSSRVDIYLMDNNNSKERFNRKDDIKWGGRGISCYEPGSVKSHSSGTIRIKSLNTGTLYLGLKHPGGYNSFNVILEVVALVKSP